MKLFKMAGATLLGTALLVTGCDGSTSPESLTNEAPKSSRGTTERGGGTCS